AWGGPSDPEFIETHCKEEDGCIWPNNEHGIYIDTDGNVWLGGNGIKPDEPIPWTTNPTGNDGFILKFDQEGNFKMRIGGPSPGPDSNDTDGGVNDTPLLDRPADMVLDPE